MGTPKPLSEYPLEYGESFLQACREPVVIECGSKGDASLLRARLYAFKRAIYYDPYAMPAVTLIAGLVKFSIDDNKLIIDRKNMLEDKISEALRKSQRPARTEVPSVPRRNDADNEQDLCTEVLP